MPALPATNWPMQGFQQVEVRRRLDNIDVNEMVEDLHLGLDGIQQALKDYIRQTTEVFRPAISAPVCFIAGLSFIGMMVYTFHSRKITASASYACTAGALFIFRSSVLQLKLLNEKYQETSRESPILDRITLTQVNLDHTYVYARRSGASLLTLSLICALLWVDCALVRNRLRTISVYCYLTAAVFSFCHAFLAMRAARAFCTAIVELEDIRKDVDRRRQVRAAL